jgi:DNA polymerase-1
MTRTLSEPSEVTLLIDGDVIAFTAACAVQRISEDVFGFVTPFANRHEGEAVVDNMMIGLEIAFKATHRRVALSDPKANWRKDVFPDYKANRKDSVRPLLLDILKDYLRSNYDAFHWDRLEADDVLGILNTEPQGYGGKRILVGKDKDFKTVPGSYHRLKDFTPSGNPVVQEITPWQAQRFHLWQTLAGDAVDGYPGCPGIGKVTADRILDNPVRLMPGVGLITRGVNKGQQVTKWVSEPTTDLWAMVVSHYQKGMSTSWATQPWALAEAAALQSAQIAYILHDGDYNRETGVITYWHPDRIITS